LDTASLPMWSRHSRARSKAYPYTNRAWKMYSSAVPVTASGPKRVTPRIKATEASVHDNYSDYGPSRDHLAQQCRLAAAIVLAMVAGSCTLLPSARARSGRHRFAAALLACDWLGVRP